MSTTGQYVIGARLREDASTDTDTYPFNVAAVRRISDIQLHPAVTFFVGENGAGKSTVLEAFALALGHSPEGGSTHALVGESASVSSLHSAVRIVRGTRRPSHGFFLRAESFFNVATYLDKTDAGLGSHKRRSSLHACSHGEAFLSLLTERLGGNGLFLLDEPEAALSPSRQLVALRAIDQLVKGGSQFIVATHSPILLAYPKSRIVHFDSNGITNIEYEETEAYAVTRDFLGNHRRRIDQLLDP